jgi:hypothetical protein
LVVVLVIRKSLPTAVLEVARDQVVELLGREVAGMRRTIADPVVAARIVGPESGVPWVPY